MTDYVALLAARGRQVLAEIADSPDVPALRLGEQLRRRYPDDLVAAAMQQQELRHAARSKFTRAEQMFFTRAGLEQASAEPVARHRAARLANQPRTADLCCGIGGDLIALSSTSHVVGVDLDPVHLLLARANAVVSGVSPELREADVRDVDLTDVQAVFVDPARRTVSRRMSVGDSEPPLDWCLGLTEHVAAVAIKASPALDRARCPPGWELEFVAQDRALKEAVLWSPALASSQARATVITADATHTLARRADAGRPELRAPGAYLLDPNPAVTRAGLVAELADDVSGWQIDAQIAFLSADEPMTSPFGRSLRVLDSGPWHEKRLSVRLRELDIGSVDIRRRGLAGDVEQIRKRFKLSGTRRATVVMTRVNDRPWALICADSSG